MVFVVDGIVVVEDTIDFLTVDFWTVVADYVAVEVLVVFLSVLVVVVVVVIVAVAVVVVVVVADVDAMEHQQSLQSSPIGNSTRLAETCG